jgi:hypothetical protein
VDAAASYGFEIGPSRASEAPLRVLREAGEIHLPGGVLRLPLDVTGHSSRLRLPATALDDDEPQAVLEAAFDGRIPLIGIEEPATALHPARVSALYDAAARTQVIVTSQSSDLLGSEYTRLDHLRAVSNVDGVTRIGGVDAAGQAIVEKGLMSISELHRSGQTRPEQAEPSAVPDRIRTK